MTLNAAMIGAIAAGGGFSGPIWESDGSSLTGWTVSGPATVDTGVGLPAPSLRAWPTNGWAYISPPGVTDLIGKSIQFDCKLGSGSANLCNFFFGCNSSGAGRMLRIDGRSANACGVAVTSSWASWSAPANTFPNTDTNWHTYRIDIKPGPVVDVWQDGVKKLSNVSIALNGTFIAIHGDGGSQGGNFDNLSIFNTPTT